jgi:hypothetical protein
MSPEEGWISLKETQQQFTQSRKPYPAFQLGSLKLIDPISVADPSNIELPYIAETPPYSQPLIVRAKVGHMEAATGRECSLIQVLALRFSLNLTQKRIPVFVPDYGPLLRACWV